MANDQFERIMRFAARTGDRLIVTDPAGKEPLVIMALDEYEALVEGALGPGDFSMPGMDDYDEDDFDEDEYGEAPTLEIVERMVEEAAEVPTAFIVEQAVNQRAEPERPRVMTPQPITKPEEKKIPQKRDNPSEEQFYLEPL